MLELGGRQGAGLGRCLDGLRDTAAPGSVGAVTGSSGTRRPAPVGDRRDRLLRWLLRILLRSLGYDAARVVFTRAGVGGG